MKKRKLLSTLVIGALVGAMTMGTNSPVSAQTDIYINNSGSGTNTYKYGYANNDYLYASNSSNVSPSNYDKRFEYWAGHGDWDDRLFMSGGALTTTGSHNTYLYASGGDLNVSSGTLNLYYDSSDGFSSSYIGSAVNLTINSGATVNMYSSGSSITLNEGDHIYGKITASNGTLTISGGDHNLGASTIANAVNFAVTGGTVRFNSASNIGTNFNNAGTVYLNGGTLSTNITNSGSGNIYFNGTNNAGTVQGGTNHNVIITGSSTNTGNISVKGLYVGQTTTDTGNFVNDGSITTSNNLTVRSGSTFTNNSGHTLNIGGDLYTNGGAVTTIANADNVNLTGTYQNAGTLKFQSGIIANAVNGAGTTEVNTGSVTSNVKIDQALNVKSGTFENATGGSVTGLTTISSGATVNNTSGTLNSVSNAGKLNISGGSISSITNTATGATNGVAQSAGSVTNVSNSGVYSQTGGSVATVSNTGTYNLSNASGNITDYTQSAGNLNLSGNASLTITDAVNGITGQTNVISGGNVSLGSSSTSLGNLTIANGKTNTASVTTTGGSGLNINNGALTTAAGTNIADGAVVTIGTADDTTGTLNVSNGSVALNTNDNWNAEGDINVSGNGTLNLKGVTQNGTFTQTGGTTNVMDNQTLGTDTSITDGEFSVDDGVTLTFTGGTLTAGDGATYVYLEENSVFDIQGGTVTLDGGSNLDMVEWYGNVLLNGGSLILSNIKDTSQYAGGNKDGGILNAQSGNLTINSSTVLLGDDDIIAQAVNLTLKGNIIVDSGANAYIDSSDDWTVGNIEQTGGTLTLDGVSTAAGKVLNSDGGDLNVVNTVTLETGSDYITEDTVINLAEGNTLVINNSESTVGITFDNGDTTTSRDADTWEGAIELNGGLLTFKDRTGTAADSTDDTKTFNMTDGTLVLDNSSLTLNEGSEIADGTVYFDSSDLVFNNNFYDNCAKVMMLADDGSTLTIQGGDTTTDPDYPEYTALELLAGSILDYGNVTVGDGTNENYLYVWNDSEVGGDVVLNILENAGVSVDDTASLVINGTGASEDVWEGTIYQDGGTIMFLDNVVKDSTTADLISDGGSIIVGYVDSTDPTLNQAGTLTLNNENDLITYSTDVTINSNGKLVQSNGSVFLDNTDDWDGAIELSGTGDLTLSGRTDSTDATQTFNQTAGILTIDEGGSLTLNTDVTDPDNPVSSSISGTSEVVLGSLGADTTDPSDDTAGTLIVNNGLTTNQAKVTTVGTNTSNAFSVTGEDTEFTTLTDTNFTVGSVTVGNGTDASALNLSNNAIIAKEVALTVAKDSIMNIDGTTAQATINTGDVWNGQINQTSGILRVLNDDYTKSSTTGYLTSDGGIIIIGDAYSTPAVAGTLKLNNVQDKITGETLVGISTNGTLAQSAGDVVIDGGNESTTGIADYWGGAIELSGGTLEMNGRMDFTDDTITFNQTGGTLNLEDDYLYIATADSVISSGNVNINNESVLVLDNGTANTAKVVMSDGTDSELAVIGEGTVLTTSIGTNLATGTVYLGDGITTDTATINLSNDGIIDEAVELNIAQGSVLNVNGALASAVIDGATDSYLGDVNLSAGTLEMKDMTLTTGVTPTAAGGTQPYYSQIDGALTMTNTTLTMADASLISGGDLTVDTTSTFNSLANGFSVDNLTNAGLINAINGDYENYTANYTMSAGDTLGDNQADFNVDLYARCDVNSDYKYDTFGSDGADILAENGTDAVFNVSDWNLNGDIFGWDAPVDRSYDMSKLFKGSVDTAVSLGQNISFTATDKEVFTPIGWYGLHSNGGGNYSFSLNRFNPGVYRGQVATVAQYQNQLMIDDILFSHTMLDNGFKGNDYITSNPNRLASGTDLYPPYQYSRKDGGVWVKAYGTFERLNMNHGLSVGNNAYGTLIGVDFGMKDLRHGWQFMPTAYIGYNGAHQYWDGNSNYQNGGQLGVMGTWYKNDFMIGALAYGGVYGNEMNTPRGHDDAFNYFVGGSVKAAYNWRFAKDWSLQPNLMVAYNYFGQQNWHSDFGQMGMMSGMLNGINVAPGLNLIWEKETFSIYATLQYMYNCNQSSSGRAGHVDLPNVHMDRGYIQYGIGANKKFSDRFSGFLQCVIRNVGRTGIGLQGGFQWQLGKVTPNERIQKGNVTPELKKTEIKVKGTRIQ